MSNDFFYSRPQWKGTPLTLSDGTVLPGWDECPSCLHFHHTDHNACDGKRRFTDRQCEAALLPELRCERPAEHKERHEAIVEGHLVTWEPWAPTERPSRYVTEQKVGWLGVDEAMGLVGRLGRAEP